MKCLSFLLKGISSLIKDLHVLKKTAHLAKLLKANQSFNCMANLAKS